MVKKVQNLNVSQPPIQGGDKCEQFLGLPPSLMSFYHIACSDGFLFIYNRRDERNVYQSVTEESEI